MPDRLPAKKILSPIIHLPLTRWCGLVAACLAVLCLPGTARAQEPEPIETDRPDITNSPKVVGPGTFQVETGVQWERVRQGRQSDRGLFTPLLLRQGLSNRWEARLETSGYSHLRSSAPGRSVERTGGYSPLEIGAKYQFQDPPEGSRRPTLGVMFQVRVPSGSGHFGTDRVTGSARLLAGWEITPRWSLTANLGDGIGEDENGSFWYPLATLSASYETTKRLTTFAELAYQGAELSLGGKGLLFDGGFLYRVGQDTQLDLGIGTSLTERQTPDLFWTFGLSHRFR